MGSGDENDVLSEWRDNYTGSGESRVLAIVLATVCPSLVGLAAVYQVFTG